MATSQIWPPVVDPATLSRQVWNVETARSLPGVGRALQIYGGLISQCDLDEYAGTEIVHPRPWMLTLPDVALRSRSTFVRVHVEDYLLHGNAVHLVTARDRRFGAAGARWFPAHMWSITDPSNSADGGIDYYLNGRKVPRDLVVHVQRGAHPVQPWRGVGVVEEHLETLNRAGLEEASEAKNLAGGAVPSVAVIAPKPELELTETEAEKAKDKWIEKFSGPGREPAILPDGTQVIPLSWSPVDTDLIAARKMTLVDQANAFNLDPYWLGGESSSMTYRSPGPMFLVLLKTSLEPVMKDFEQVWSLGWWPPADVMAGRRVRFDRLQLTRDDFGTEVTTGDKAVRGGLMTREEWRARHGMPAVPELGELPTSPAAPPADDDPDADPDADPDDDDPGEGDEDDD